MLASDLAGAHSEMPGDHTESLLVGDVSTGVTRVVLLERIARSWRFLGQASTPTTFDLPEQDLCTGWLAALRSLEQRTGRQLLDRGDLITPQLPRGDGIDTTLFVASLGDPIRVALIDTGASDVTLAIVDALRQTHCRVLHSSAPHARKDSGWAERVASSLRDFQPETIILLLHGREAHAVAHVLAVIQGTAGSFQPQKAIIAGEPKTIDQARALFGATATITPVDQAEERATELSENLERDVSTAWLRQLSRADAREVLSQGLLPPIPRSVAVDLATQHLARKSGRQIACVAIDEGAHLHVATAETHYQLTFPDLDLRHGLIDLGINEVKDAARSLPFEADEDELMNWLLNRSVRPWCDLVSDRDQSIEQALARQVLRRLVAAPPLPGKPPLATSDLLLISGELTRWQHPGAAAFAVLDGLALVPESGTIELAIDDGELMAAAGVASLVDPAITGDVVTHDALRTLGSVVVVTGSAKPGTTAAELEIERGSDPVENVSIPYGELIVLPLDGNQTAKIVVKPARKLRVGIQPPGKQVTLGHDRPLAGGSVGIIVDAREKDVPGANVINPERFARWLEVLTSHDPFT